VRAEVRACKSHFFEGGSDTTVVVLPLFSLLRGPFWLGSSLDTLFLACLLFYSEKLACLHSRLLDLGTRLSVLWFEEEVVARVACIGLL
jgi:hypothetical protein